MRPATLHRSLRGVVALQSIKRQDSDEIKILRQPDVPPPAAPKKSLFQRLFGRDAGPPKDKVTPEIKVKLEKPGEVKDKPKNFKKGDKTPEQRKAALPEAPDSDDEDDEDYPKGAIFRDVPSEHKSARHEHTLFLAQLSATVKDAACKVCGKGGTFVLCSMASR